MQLIMGRAVMHQWFFLFEKFICALTLVRKSRYFQPGQHRSFSIKLKTDIKRLGNPGNQANTQQSNLTLLLLVAELGNYRYLASKAF